ncbi:MAG: hypothetical protein IKE46_05295 [Selenomonadaceae bacterium]|nr:hypothetical protein [Selenomonadaceae bacterium]
MSQPKSRATTRQKIFSSPIQNDDLAIGILAQAEKISSIDDVIRLDIDAENFLIDVETAPVEKLPADEKFHDDLHFNAKNILACADKLLGELSITHKKKQRRAQRAFVRRRKNFTRSRRHRAA